MSRPTTPQLTPATIPVTAARRYPQAPLVGVAAVILDQAGRVLLVQRGHEPRKGCWGLPGGLIDLGESLEAAVRREVLEETNLQVEVGGLLDAFEPIHYDAEGRVEFHYVVLDYWVRAVGGVALPGDDAAALAWVDPTDGAAPAAYALLPDSARMVALGRARWEEWRRAPG